VFNMLKHLQIFCRDVVSVSTSRSRDSRPSRDVLTPPLGLVSDKILNVSVSSRSRTCASRVSSRSRPKRSRRLVSGLGPFRLVETFHTGMPCKTSVLRYKPVMALVRSSWLILSNDVDRD